MIRRRLAAVAAATWLAGCVSILGVDPDDHVDVAEVVCDCADGRDTCSAALGALLEDAPAIEEAIVACAAEHEACGDLDDCLRERGICSPEGGDCTPAPKEDRVSLRCCGDLTCEGRKCVAAACSEVGDACGGSCCPGLTCDSGVCCTFDAEVCERNEDCCGTSTCLTRAGGGEKVCQACGDLNARCDGDGIGGTCCDGFECVGGHCAGI